MLVIVLLTCLSLALCELTEPLDLSHYYDDHTLYWVGSTPFHFTKVTTTKPGINWYAAKEFETAEHAGTHLDAPYHFNQTGWKIGDIPLERFFGKAVYLNLREQAANNADYQVSVAEFLAWEDENGVIPEGAVILLDFGWASKYYDRGIYFGTENVNDKTSFHFPGLSASAAEWLVESRLVYGVGTDTASMDFGQSQDFPTHRILANHNIYNLEHLALPTAGLPATGYTLLSLPMKIRNGTGAPCRVLAIP